MIKYKISLMMISIDKMVLRGFVEGIQDKVLQQSVRIGDKKTCQETLDFALKLQNTSSAEIKTQEVRRLESDENEVDTLEVIEMKGEITKTMETLEVIEAVDVLTVEHVCRVHAPGRILLINQMVLGRILEILSMADEHLLRLVEAQALEMFSRLVGCSTMNQPSALEILELLCKWFPRLPTNYCEGVVPALECKMPVIETIYISPFPSVSNVQNLKNSLKKMIFLLATVYRLNGLQVADVCPVKDVSRYRKGTERIEALHKFKFKIKEDRRTNMEQINEVQKLMFKRIREDRRPRFKMKRAFGYEGLFWANKSRKVDFSTNQSKDRSLQADATSFSND
ncbi:hypothetical protein ACDT12_13190, partial [Staphylococcus aureus]